jgi:hypothetical protein
LDLFHPVISDLDNTILCSIPEEAEIYEALLSLGREKAHGLDGELYFMLNIGIA